MTSLQKLVDETRKALKPDFGAGKVADYIPALANVDPRKFAITIATVDGQTVSTGDSEEPFSVQSISKVFTLTRVLDEFGDDLWKRIGREPSGDPFNSIVQLEREKGIPRNPFINAGALVVTDEYIQHTPDGDMPRNFLQWMHERAGDNAISYDEEVRTSEAATGFRNRSLANFLAGFGNIQTNVDAVLNGYFHQCSIAMSTRQLAHAGLFLANDGVDPRGNHPCIPGYQARRINALMLTCGHYDASGDFAFRVGLPGKSGVGGGILCIVPETAAIVVWSPGLNDVGNSLLGTRALETMSREMDWSIF